MHVWKRSWTANAAGVVIAGIALLPANSNDQRGRWDDNVIFRYIFVIELYTYICMAHSTRAQSVLFNKAFFWCRKISSHQVWNLIRHRYMECIHFSVYVWRRDKKNMWEYHRSYKELCTYTFRCQIMYTVGKLSLIFFYGNNSCCSNIFL